MAHVLVLKDIMPSGSYCFARFDFYKKDETCLVSSTYFSFMLNFRILFQESTADMEGNVYQIPEYNTDTTKVIHYRNCTELQYRH